MSAFALDGCIDSNASNFDAAATAQAYDQYGNLECVYASCEDIPEYGCIYGNGFGAFNAEFGAADCVTYGGTACTDDDLGCIDSNASNFDASATAQAYDQYGNLECVYASCEDIPEYGCIYVNGFSAFNAEFGAADCVTYGGMPCELSMDSCVATNGICSTCTNGLATGCTTVVSCNTNYFDTNGIASDGCEAGCADVTDGTCTDCTNTVASGCTAVTCATNKFDTNGIASDGCEAGCADVTDGTCIACTTAVASGCTAVTCATNKFDTNGDATDGCETPMAFRPANRDALKTAVDACLKESPSGSVTYETISYGVMNTWDTSLVTNMSSLFRNAQAFNADISEWDTAAVTDMSSMFYGAYAFNQYINQKEVPALQGFNAQENAQETDAATAVVETTTATVATAAAAGGSAAAELVAAVAQYELSNQNIASGCADGGSGCDITWAMAYMADDIANVAAKNANIINTNNALRNAQVAAAMAVNTLNVIVGMRPYTAWDTNKVTNMKSMFWGAVTFNKDISGWNTAAVTDMSTMFLGAQDFDGDITGWNTTSVSDDNYKLAGATAQILKRMTCKRMREEYRKSSRIEQCSCN